MSGRNYTQVPTIILKGQWLKVAGFEVGLHVEVVSDGDKDYSFKNNSTKKTATKKSVEDKIKNQDDAQREKLSNMIKL